MTERTRAPHRVVVIGGGITGLSCAVELLDGGDRVSVTVLEASGSTGGLIRTSAFAGVDCVDEGADAWLMRVPWATDLADRLGLSGDLAHPTGAHASVWRGRMHRIPREILLGVPAGVRTLAFGSLLSPVGKVRAAMEPLLPRGADPHDSLGALVRSRFGREVHERLVDPLVGSIYAADTDAFSLEAVPQIAELAGHRSLLTAAMRARRRAAPTAGPSPAPVFAAPAGGVGRLCAEATRHVTDNGGVVRTRCRVASVSRRDNGRDNGRDGNDNAEWLVVTDDGEELRADSIVLAVPAATAAPLVAEVSESTSRALARWEHASVVMVTLAVPREQWPASLVGSGYLVPKPDQRWVTAASFGSNKWAHWRPGDGSMILRVSLGRDGLDLCHHDDDSLLAMCLADLKRHLGRDFDPVATRISRWPASFPQYRPGHFVRLTDLEGRLAADTGGAVRLAGASYRGIGIPACVQQGRTAAREVLARAGVQADGRAG